MPERGVFPPHPRCARGGGEWHVVSNFAAYDKITTSSFPRRRESKLNEYNILILHYYFDLNWIPAYAGMTTYFLFQVMFQKSLPKNKLPYNFTFPIFPNHHEF